jgi:predicted PurR-regulated permease PerM
MPEISAAKSIAELGAVAVVLVLVVLVVIYLINSNKTLVKNSTIERENFQKILDTSVKSLAETISEENKIIQESFRQNNEGHRYQREEHNEMKNLATNCTDAIVKSVYDVQLTIAKMNGKNGRRKR